MERGLILLAAALMINVAPAVQGTSHLSFANNTQVNITRDGCGVTKLCVETPDACDPAANTSCLFVSLMTSAMMAPNGTKVAVELSGESMGYIALGLTADPTMGITLLFVCGHTNGSFTFQTANRNNTDSMVSPAETMVQEIQGKVEGNRIMCEFCIPNVNASQTRTTDTTFSVLLGTGVLTGGNVGAFTVSRDSGPLNIADPASNVMSATASPNTTTDATMTTSSSGSLHPCAVLSLLSLFAVVRL